MGLLRAHLFAHKRSRPLACSLLAPNFRYPDRPYVCSVRRLCVRSQISVARILHWARHCTGLPARRSNLQPNPLAQFAIVPTVVSVSAVAMPISTAVGHLGPITRARRRSTISAPLGVFLASPSPYRSPPSSPLRDGKVESHQRGTCEL